MSRRRIILTEGLEAFPKVVEADDAKDGCDHEKHASDDINRGKESPLVELPSKGLRGKESSPASNQQKADSQECGHPSLSLMSDGGPSEPKPRDHDLQALVKPNTHQIRSRLTMHAKTENA